MIKANTLLAGEKRRCSPRGRSLKRLPLRLRLNPDISFFVDIVDDEEEAALIRKLQQKGYEAALQYEREHNSQWWD